MKGGEDCNKLKCRAKREKRGEGKSLMGKGGKIQGVIGSWEDGEIWDKLMWLMKTWEADNGIDNGAGVKCGDKIVECHLATGTAVRTNITDL